MKLLVVEDDRALNQGIALSFGSETVVQAFCVKEARALFDDSIDLVILDINLPDGSGLELDEGRRQIVGQIETQTEKLNFLIASLVKTSRLENGIIAVAPKQNCVGELLRQLDHAYAAGAGHADGLTKTALTEACRTRILALGQSDQAE